MPAPGRVTDLLRAATARGRITTGDVRDQQADVTLLDAQFFTPYIVAALDRARRSGTPQLAALGQDARVIEAVGRFARWQHTAPTGIPEGYDAADRDGRLGTPSAREIDESVAATLYAVWRGQYIRGVIDAHLTFPVPVPGDRDSLKAIKQLLVDFDARRGVGRSGLDFYAVPGVADAADRRDVLLLRSLAEALDLLAGDAFAPAFGRSGDQSAYRWGKLHRGTLASPLGAPFTVPSAGNPFGTPLPGLTGIPVDGGLYTVDVANHNSRGNTADGFMFRFGPARRFVAQPSALGMRAESSLAGPISETLGERARTELLRSYLTNDTYRLRLHPADLAGGTASVTTFVPGRRS